ncbi:unnamed protein product [Schistosoma haematobium]|nr:unnamed protein product [Schistosoma haematobium]
MTSHLRGWVIYILLLFLRFLFVFDLQSGYLHPDEYFQGIEVAAGDIYNLDVLRTWEFQLDDKGPLRSVAGMSPFVHIPIQAAKWIHGGIDYKTEETDFNGSDMLNRILFPSRLVTVLGSYLVDLFILRCCIRVDHHQVSAKQTKIQKILHAVQYHSVPTALLLYASCAFGGSLWSTRTIVNVWESIYVSLFGLLFLEVLDRLEQSSDPTVNKQSLILFMCIQSAVVVWGTFLRPTYILFILPLGIIELAFILVKFKYISMILCLPSVLLVFFNTFICVIIDTLYFHNVSLLQAFQVDFSRFKLIYTPYRFLTYNSNSYHVSSHGLHSRFTHFLINWPLIFGPIFTFRLFTQPLQRRSISSCIAWISVVFPTFVLSTIPHQEARFLIPCLPCACFVVGQSVDAKVRHTKRKDVSCTCISILVLWIFHQFILILFYGYLHQAGLFSYMRTIPSNVTGCVTHVFFRTYMPPRFLLNIPLEKSSHYPSQSCKSLIDLGGSNVTILNNTINHLKTYQNFSGILKLAYPGSIQPLENLLLSSWGNVVMCEQFFPHLSMENPPSIRHPFVYENWKSQLSLHESNTFGMTIDKHTIFETSNPLTESVKHLPGITYESRVLGHFQNPELFHSPVSLPKLTPSPDVKNRSHLSSINNKPLVLNISNPRFPPINSSKSTTTNDFSGLWPTSISLSNRIINKNNDGSLILQNDSFIPKALSDQQDFRIPTSIINGQIVVQNPSSICLAANNISVTISPALPNLITSSAFCCPTRFIPESVKTTVSNRTFCFVSSRNVAKLPSVCVHSTLINQEIHSSVAAPDVSYCGAIPYPRSQPPRKSGDVSQVPVSTLSSFVNEINYLEESCLDIANLKNAPDKSIQQHELSPPKNLFHCDYCTFTSSNSDRLFRHINSRHLSSLEHDKVKPSCLQVHPTSLSDISNQIIITSDYSSSSSSSFSITNSTSSLPVTDSTSSSVFETTVSNTPSTFTTHDNNNYRSCNLLPSESFPNIPVTVCINKSTCKNSSHNTLSKSSSRRKQSFPFKMPGGSDLIQLPVVYPNNRFCDLPLQGVELSVNNKGSTLLNESSCSSYASGSTLDDTSDEKDSVFLGFTHMGSSRKRLHSPEGSETSLFHSSSQQKNRHRKNRITSNRHNVTSLVDHGKSINFSSYMTISKQETKRYFTSKESTLLPVNSSFPLRDISVTLERLNDIPEYGHTDSDSSIINISSTSSEYSYQDTQRLTPDKIENPELEKQRMKDGFSLSYDNFKSSEQGTLSHKHNELNEDSEQIKKHPYLNELPVAVDSNQIEMLKMSNNRRRPSGAKKYSKQLEIPDEFLTLQSRSEMEADELQVDILTGEIFVKNIPLRTLVTGLKRPRFYQLELDYKVRLFRSRGHHFVASYFQIIYRLRCFYSFPLLIVNIFHTILRLVNNHLV